MSRGPNPPYYAVIFTSTLKKDSKGYEEMAGEMEALARLQPGFLFLDSVRSDMGITVSYWDSLAAILNWKNNIRHQTAQKLGKEKWYASYNIRICKVEREYSFQND